MARVGVVVAALVAVAALSSACTGDDPEAAAADPGSSATTTSAEPTPPSSPSPPTTTEQPATYGPGRFLPAAARETVHHLARDIGPRLAASPAFDRAADWVQRRFASYGYDVSNQRIRVPAGDSWGVPVGAGTSRNVLAAPPDFDPSRPWRLVGAHLDTVAVAPGAEDNGSGVAVLLELARLAAGRPTALPTVFVAFGAEEPLGEGEAMHHFGSRLHADGLPPAELRTLRAMVALDRVGVGDGGVVPVCTGGVGPLRVRDDLIATARGLGIPTSACADNTSSDHYSYELVGVTAARLGSTPYAGYHSAADVPAVVEPAQLGRVGRLMWTWLQP